LGADADTFVFEEVAKNASGELQIAPPAEYSPGQGDIVYLPVVLANMQNLPFADAAMAGRAHEVASNRFVMLEVNVSDAQTPHWTDVAQLQGVNVGDVVHVVIDAHEATAATAAAAQLQHAFHA